MLCHNCNKNRNIEDFSFRNKARNTRHKICKICHSLYRNKHYLQNKDKYLTKARKWNKKQGEVLSKFLFNVLSKAQCIDCNEKDILVLDFDHINGKMLDISTMYKNRYSLAKVKTELQKCEIRCANCHRRRTAKALNYWKYRMVEI